MNEMSFEVRGEFVTLDALLKFTGLAPSGGAAKMLVAQGQVRVGGQVELRKTHKLRPGAVVEIDQTRVTVVAASAALAPTAMQAIQAVHAVQPAATVATTTSPS